MVWTQGYQNFICLAWWSRWMPGRLEKDCCWWLTFWLAFSLLERQSPPTVFLKTDPHPDDHVKHITNTSESDQECVQFFTRYKNGRLAMVRLPWIPYVFDLQRIYTHIHGFWHTHMNFQLIHWIHCLTVEWFLRRENNRWLADGTPFTNISQLPCGTFDKMWTASATPLFCLHRNTVD